MNALRQWLYRGTISCAMCFIIALTLYNRTNHVNVKYHKCPVWNCHSEDKHSICIGMLISSITKYINMCSIVFVFCLVCFLNGDWFMQREQTPMFAREIIYTSYFYLQKRKHVGSINEFSSKTRLSLIDRMTKHKN